MLAAAALLLCVVCVHTTHIKREAVNPHVREDFQRLGQMVDKQQLHEVVFAVQQRNLEELERTVLERSTPGTSLYQSWLSYSEVNELVSNEAGANEVTNWLRANDIEPTWKSKQHHYIKATASIEKWEALFDTEFHQFEDHSSPKKRKHIRTLQYSLPEEISSHISAVFNTVQVPPSLRRRAKRKMSRLNSTSEGSFKTNLRYVPQDYAPTTAADMKPLIWGVSVNFLNALYEIPSNIGDANIKQAVFETADEYFSPTDLKQFQTNNGITAQAATSIGSHSTSACSLTGRGNDCWEGNLDIQFLMGIAQVCLVFVIYCFVILNVIPGYNFHLLVY